ncbi:MAG: hypothetical protein GX862_11525 [Leucobacter sp.]|nr:hypothetical protein [Leucobacter sp.]
MDLLLLCALACVGVYFGAIWLFEFLWRRELRRSLITVLIARDRAAPIEALLRAAGAWSLMGEIVVLDFCGIDGGDKLVRDGLCLAVCSPDELAGTLERLSLP